MSFFLRLLAIAYVLLGTPSFVSAEQLSLSMQEALARADERAPELVLADHRTQEVQARREGAGIILPSNPRLSVDVRPPLKNAPLREIGYSATLDMLFDLGGAPSARVKEVERDVELAHAERSLLRLDARLAVFSSYVGAQLAELRIASARSGIEIAQGVLDAARKRLELGAGSDFEQASAELELSKLKASEHAALRERAENLMALREALDLAADAQLTLTTAIEEPALLQPVASYVNEALQHHPSLVASSARTASLQASQKRLERETFPKLGLYAGVDASPVSPIFGIVGISGELPVAQRNQGPRAVVARALATEELRAELTRRKIARDVQSAWAAYEERRAELYELTQAALPAAQRSFALAEAGWKAGRFDWFRVAFAARELVAVRAQRIEALSALWTQRLILNRARGGDTP